MQNNFTSSFYYLLGPAFNVRKLTIAVFFLTAILAASVYLKAAIVSTPVTLPVSSDKAWNGPAAAFTPLNNVVIKEEDNGDFRDTPAGFIFLTAPAGWVFKAAGVTASVANIGPGQSQQVNITVDNNNITYPTPNGSVTQPNSTTIRIPYAANGTNRLDQITFSGVEVMALDGANLTPGNVTFSVNNAANIGGQFSVTVATLTQTIGSPAKLAFQTQPGATNTSLAGADLLNQPQVVIQDFFGRVVSTATNPVSLSIQSGPDGAVLTAASANAVNGVATFSGVKLNLGGVYTLTATSQLVATGPAATVVSNSFTVNNRPATITSISPACVSVGDPASFTATIQGSDFVPGATVRVTSLNFGVSTTFTPSNADITPQQIRVVIAQFPGLSTIPPLTDGQYRVEVLNPGPIQSGPTSTGTFTIHPILLPGSISGPTAPICAVSDNVTLRAPTGFTNYTWSIPPGAGTITAGQGTNEVTINFADPGQAQRGVTVGLSAINGCNKPSSTDITVTVTQAPVAAITAPNGTQSCAPVILQATPAGAATYEWRINGNPIPGAPNNRIYNVITSGVYSVEITNSTGCSAVSNAIAVVVITPANVITNGTIARFCAGNNVVLQALTGNNYTYQWFNSSGPLSGQTGSSLTVSTAGTYYVTLRTPNGCAVTSALTTVSETPAISNNVIDAGIYNYCVNGNPGVLTASEPTGGLGSGSYMYQWQRRTAGNTFSDITGANARDYNPGPLTQTTYYRRLVTSGPCADFSLAIEIAINPQITSNTITAPTLATVCANTVPGSITGVVPTGGTSSFNYQWQSSTNGTNYTAITGANGINYSPPALTQTTSYRRIAASGGCISTSNAVTISVGPGITNNVITAPSVTAICTNTTPGTINSSGLPAGGGGAGTYSFQWQSSTSATFTTFANVGQGANFTPGPLTQTTYFRRLVTSGGCASTSNVVTITVNAADTYTLLLTTSPFPVCQGNTTYTARVIKNAASVTYPTNENIQTQPVTYTGGEDVSSQFIFDWWKDDDINRRRGNLGTTISDGAIRSGEYYTVRARPRTTLACATYNNRADLIPANDPDQNVLFSNRIFSAGSGQSFSVAIAASITGIICPGTAVTFTATPNQPNIPNARYQWLINGNEVAGQTRTTFTANTLRDKDQVSVRLNSAGNSCGGPATATPITMAVVVPQMITGGGTYCPGDNFSGAAIGLQSSQVGVFYQLMRGSDEIFFPIQGNGGPLNFGYHKFAAGIYTVTATPALSPSNTTTCTLPMTGTAPVVVTPQIINSIVSFTGPDEPQIGQQATYTANPVNTTIPWTYRWTILYGDGTSAATAETSATLVISAVRADMIGLTVVQVAPANICVDVATFSTPVQNLTPLPVEMLYFTAEKKANNLVVLEWATAMEKMNEGFQIEVSQDAVNYRTLSFVPTKNGNITAKQVYTFHDKENGKYGTRYYRIKQLDVDGTSEYFGPKAVTMDELVVDQVSAYPNPFRSEVNLEVNAEAAGSMHVLVSNAVGAKVLERTVNVQKGSNKAQLQLNPNLPLGMYIITTRLNGKTSHIKLMKE